MMDYSKLSDFEINKWIGPYISIHFLSLNP
nr:MAG TPA: Protein of unknown function (DUF2591) [Caudoviricetes sp.]